MLMFCRMIAVAIIASLGGLGVTAAPAADNRADDAPPELRPTGPSGELRPSSEFQLAFSGKMKVDSCYETNSEGETIQQCDMTFVGPDIEADVRMTSESSNWEQHLYDQFQSCQEEGRVAEGDATINAIFHDDGTGEFSNSTSLTKCVKPS